MIPMVDSGVSSTNRGGIDPTRVNGQVVEEALEGVPSLIPAQAIGDPVAWSIVRESAIGDAATEPTSRELIDRHSRTCCLRNWRCSGWVARVGKLLVVSLLRSDVASVRPVYCRETPLPSKNFGGFVATCRCSAAFVLRVVCSWGLRPMLFAVAAMQLPIFRAFEQNCC